MEKISFGRWTVRAVHSPLRGFRKLLFAAVRFAVRQTSAAAGRYESEPKKASRRND